MIALIAALAGAAYTIWRIQAHQHRPAPVTTNTGRGTATTPCTVLHCDQAGTVNVHAGHDWWVFCPAHATPYLTEGMKP